MVCTRVSPLLHVLLSPGEPDQVDRLGGPPCEDDLLGLAAESKPGDLSARVLVGLRGLLSERVDRPVDVGVVTRIVVDESVDHLLGLLRRGCVVEIDQPLAVHLPLQDREVSPDLLDVEQLLSSACL